MGLFMIFLGNLFYILNVLLISTEFLALSLKKEKGLRYRVLCYTVVMAGCFSLTSAEAIRMVVLLLGTLLLLSRMVEDDFGSILSNTLLSMLFLALMDELFVVTFELLPLPEMSLYFCSSLCTFVSLILMNQYLYRRYHSFIRPMSRMQALLTLFILVMDLIMVIALQEAGFYLNHTETGMATVLSRVITVLVILMQLILLFPTIASQNLLNEKVEMSEKYLQEQNDYYRYLEKRDRETRKFRHDVRSHLVLVRDFLQEGNLEGLSSYVGQIADRVDSFGKTISLNNGIAEAIVNRYAQEAEQEGIRLSVKGYFPSDYEMKGYDLCTILSNLLNNAMEAVRSCGGKQIRLEIRHERAMLMIYMENDCDRNLVLTAGKPRTLKGDSRNHGLGLENIEDALSRYQGWMEMEAQKGVFRTCISCMMQRKEQKQEEGEDKGRKE